MQRYLEDENVFKNILKNVLKECNINGIEATEACVSLLIRLVILDPTKGFLNLSRDECSNAVDEVVELCIKKLSRELSPALLTIKIQSYFTEHFTSKDKVIFDHRLAITKLTEPLMRELMEKDVKEKNLQDALYHKLAVAITLLSGLGNPTNRAVLCSTTVALSSIFPINELPRFLALGKYDKERQIEELTHIVAGIRIFNYDTHKHVEGIVDLPSILKEACIASKESLENEKTSVTHMINLLCQLLNECYVEQQSDFDPDLVDIIVSYPLRINPDDVEFFRDLLITKHQMKIYLRQLFQRVEQCENEVDSNCDLLKQNLLELQESVRYRTAVLTSYIYPKFIQVSFIWNTLQDQMVLLSSYNELLENLRDFFMGFDHKANLLETLVESMLARKRRRKEMGEEPIQEKDEDTRIDGSRLHNCEVIYPREDGTTDAPQFLGCCALRIIKGNGLLLPGNPKIGYLNFGMLNYAFATCESAYTFDRHPEMYLKEIFRLIRKMPELIDVLDMNSAVERYMHLKEIQKQTDEEIVQINSETQTMVHPVESFIDPEYSWDIWELKRRAVELANISKKKTHSTQTVQSHMRANVGTQTYTGKEVSTQTKKDNKATMPKLSTFIFGLRGRNVKLAHTAILTRPHDEWLYEPGARVLDNVDSAKKIQMNIPYH